MTELPEFVYDRNTMGKELYLNDFQKKALELCLAVYRILDLFPENDVFKNQIKELANSITADILAIERIGAKIPLYLPAEAIKSIFDSLALDIVKNIEKLIGYFQIAQAEKRLLVNPINFDILIREYQKLEEKIFSCEPTATRLLGLPEKEDIFDRVYYAQPVKEQRAKAPIANRASAGIKNSQVLLKSNKTKEKKELNPRQRKILEFLKKNQEAKMADLNGVFKNEVTERTLRNDLRDLTEQGMIRAEGEFKTRKYYLK